MSALLIWFSFSNCCSARPVAQYYLRGMALSMGQAIESISSRDTSLKLLADFRSPDIAYFALLDKNGTIRFHTNSDLTGKAVEDGRYRQVFANRTMTEERVALGTGETVFESQQLLHLESGALVLRMALHTWQADQIIKRAHAGGGMMMSLMLASWALGLWTLRLQRREQQRRERLARYEHLAQLGQFGAVLAHEVRTPLSGIKGYAQLLEERLTDERQQKFAQGIISESQRLEVLVNDLLVYARQDLLLAGSTIIGVALQEAWEQMLAGTSVNGVHFEVLGNAHHPVACPPDRLRQVLLNLFSNAVQAMPEGGRLQVVLSEAQGCVVLAVVDSGPGFKHDDLPRIFDPFFTTYADGSGLGLAVCRKIVEGYGGTITAANNDFGGAEVTVCLPFAKERD